MKPATDLVVSSRSSPCVVCEPDWLTNLLTNTRLRVYWQTLPRMALSTGQEWLAGINSVAALLVEDGLLATLFVDVQGRERVHHFHATAHWLTPPLGLPDHAWRIEAQVPSRVLVLSAEHLEAVKLWEPRVEGWLLQALTAERQRLIQREHQWRMLSATERYVQVLQEAPIWLDDIPQHRLASYLGVTDVALSRIRRRLKEGSAGN